MPAALVAGCVVLGSAVAVGFQTGIIETRSPVNEEGGLQSPVVIDLEELRRYWEMMNNRSTSPDPEDHLPLASFEQLQDISQSFQAEITAVCPQAPNPVFSLTNHVEDNEGNQIESDPIPVCIDAQNVTIKNAPVSPSNYWLSVPLTLDPAASMIDWESGVSTIPREHCEAMIDQLTDFARHYINNLPVEGLDSVQEPIIVTPSVNQSTCISSTSEILPSINETD